MEFELVFITWDSCVITGFGCEARQHVGRCYRLRRQFSWSEQEHKKSAKKSKRFEGFSRSQSRAGLKRMRETKPCRPFNPSSRARKDEFLVCGFWTKPRWWSHLFRRQIRLKSGRCGRCELFSLLCSSWKPETRSLCTDPGISCYVRLGSATWLFSGNRGGSKLLNTLHRIFLRHERQPCAWQKRVSDADL